MADNFRLPSDGVGPIAEKGRERQGSDPIIGASRLKAFWRILPIPLLLITAYSGTRWYKSERRIEQYQKLVNSDWGKISDTLRESQQEVSKFKKENANLQNDLYETKRSLNLAAAKSASRELDLKKIDQLQTQLQKALAEKNQLPLALDMERKFSLCRSKLENLCNAYDSLSTGNQFSKPGTKNKRPNECAEFK